MLYVGGQKELSVTNNIVGYRDTPNLACEGRYAKDIKRFYIKFEAQDEAFQEIDYNTGAHDKIDRLEL